MYRFLDINMKGVIMEILYKYCWSCGKPHPKETKYKNCTRCRRIYLQNPYREYDICWYCQKPKKKDKYTLCTRCYVAMLRRNGINNYDENKE